MGFEQTVDNAVNGFAMWALQFEIIIGIICTAICFVVGCRYLTLLVLGQVSSLFGNYIISKVAGAFRSESPCF